MKAGRVEGGKRWGDFTDGYMKKCLGRHEVAEFFN